MKKNLTLYADVETRNKYVSVIIPVRNEKKYISQCIDSILNQDYPMDRLEILVIDGMSEDGTRAILEKYVSKYTNLIVIDNPNRIVPTAMNIGLKNYKGEVIIRLDAHSVYSRDYISKCVYYLTKTNADNVGGPMRAKGIDYISKAIALAYNSVFGLGGGKFHKENWEGEVDTVYLGAWQKKVFDKYGLFNEKLMRNQDIEHNARIKKAGGKVFLTPAIRSYYYCRANLKDLWLQNFRNGFWNINTMKIAQDALSLRHFIPLFFVLSLLTTWMIPKLWLIILLSYMFFCIFFSVKTVFKKGFKYLFIMPVVFLTLHLSYGLGSVTGILTYPKENT